MKAAAAAKTGRQRAAIHNRTGNSSAIGTTVVQGSCGNAMTMTLMTMSDASATRPSMVSLARRRLACCRGEPDHQWRNRDDAERIGCEPVLPSDEDRCRRAMEQGKSQGPADPGDCSCDDRCPQQPQHVAQPVETERRTKVALDQAGRQQGFPRIAYGEDDGAQEVSIAQEIGHDSRDHCPAHDRPSRMRPKRDQRARGDPGGRPEHGHAVGSEQGKAQLCRQDIDAADHDGEPDSSSSIPTRGRPRRSLGLHSQILQHVAVSDGLTQSPRLRGRAGSRAWAVGPSRASGLR